MSRIKETFEKIRKNKNKALVTFVTVGDPSIEASERIIVELEKSGSDIIELGVPFSDPLADGPTIQRASQRSLMKGTTLNKVIKLVKKIRNKITAPLVIMTSINIINNYGFNKFAKDAAEAGLDGVILPDLPPEESYVLKSQLNNYRIDLVFLVAPTSTEDRVKLIANNSSGFVYLISSTGVTGARAKISLSFKKILSRVRKHTKLPVVVGFGISTEEQAKQIGEVSDGVVVGSSIVAIIEKYANSPSLYNKVGAFTEKLKKALEGVKDE